MEARQQTIDLCSCPRRGGEPLTGPICPVDNCLEGKSRTVLFVQMPQGIVCNAAMHFGNSIVCNCPARQKVYLDFGI